MTAGPAVEPGVRPGVAVLIRAHARGGRPLVSDGSPGGPANYRVGVSEGRAARTSAPKGALLAAVRRARAVRTVDRLWRLTRETVKICMRYRVTGLASEAGFFALLSLPPLILGLFGGVGYVGQAIGRDNVQALQEKITDLASKVLTSSTVASADHPDPERRLQERPRRPDLDRLPALAVVRLAGAERLRRHHLDHVRPERGSRDRPHPGAVLQPVRRLARGRRGDLPARHPRARSCSATSSTAAPSSCCFSTGRS